MRSGVPDCRTGRGRGIARDEAAEDDAGTSADELLRIDLFKFAKGGQSGKCGRLTQGRNAPDRVIANAVR